MPYSIRFYARTAYVLVSFFTRRLLTATLQLLIALSIHKTNILLHKLDVNLLGAPASQKGTSVSIEYIRMPTLTPMLLPRNQVGYVSSIAEIKKECAFLMMFEFTHFCA